MDVEAMQTVYPNMRKFLTATTEFQVYIAVNSVTSVAVQASG
ncbi:hypothetical protein [Mesorhizobium sp. M0309]